MTTPTDQSADEWAHQLTAQLAELADEAPLAQPAPELWDRGRRYQRLRRGGTVLIAAAACLALVLLGTVVERRDADPTPAPAGAPVGLPDRIFSPSPWLPGTDEAGPLGQLIAVREAERGGWWGQQPGVVGISASTGEYRFLDLPDQAIAPGQGVALSPDGRHVAYWLTGETAGSPHSTEEDVVTGVAVLDTASGDVVRHQLESEHGFSGETLLWTSSDTLVFAAGEAVTGVDGPEEERNSWHFAVLHAWSPTSGPDRAPRPVPGLESGVWVEAPVASGNLIVERRTGRYQVVDPWRGPVGSLMVSDARFPLEDPAGRRVVALHQGPSAQIPNKLVLGPSVAVGDAGTSTSKARLSPIPGTAGTFALLRWTDDDHVAVLRRDAPSRYTSSLFEVDVTSGEARRLTWMTDSVTGGAIQFAIDLLTAPIVDAQKPPAPMDPRWVTTLATLGVLAGVGGIIWWRRRVRP